MRHRGLLRIAASAAVLLGLGLQAGAPLYAEPAEGSPSEIVRQVEAAYARAQDIQAGFTQRVTFKDFDTPFLSKGQVYLTRGKMRWDYQEPSKQQIFVNQEEVLYYVPEHQQVIKSSLSAETDSQVPLGLLSGTTRLSEHFDVSLQSPPGKTYRLRLVPKEKGIHTGPIEIEVSAPTYLIQKITLDGQNGNRSVFEFSKFVLNQGLKEGTFSFVIPKGVEVVVPPPLR